MSDLKTKTVNGVIWNSIDRFCTQGIHFVFSILIARLLVPSDYGVVAMLGIFFAISSCFIDSGIGSALIRKVDRTEVDFSTVFYFNILVACFFYGLLWVSAPYIAAFYEIPLLTDVTRVQGLTLIIGALSGIHSAKLSINIDFKSRAKISIISVLTTGGIGLWMAYCGYGVWALVAQIVTGSILRTVLLCLIVHWIPLFTFSWKSFKELFSYGSKLLVSGLLDTTYNNVYTIVIGKCFSSNVLGVYSRADSLAQFPSSNITNVLQGVTFPVLSLIQNEEERLAHAYKRFIRISAFIIFPLMIGLSVVADPLIRLVLTDKWEESIYLLQIICFSMMWYPIHAINLNILQVKGRSDCFLKLEVLKKILGVLTLCVTIPLGVVAMCYGRVFTSVVCLVLNTHYTKKIINYGYFSQMKDLAHILLHSLTMGCVVWSVESFFESLWLQLMLGIAVGIIYYMVGAHIMKFRELNELLCLIKERIGK